MKTTDNTKKVEVSRKGEVTWSSKDIRLCHICCDNLETRLVGNGRCCLFGGYPKWVENLLYYSRLEDCLRATGHLLEDEDAE